MQVLVYITRDDPACQATMRQLTLDRVWFRPIDITDDDHSKAILRDRFGYDGTAPLVIVREGMRILHHWNGHQPERLQRLCLDYWGHRPIDDAPGFDPAALRGSIRDPIEHKRGIGD